MSIDNHSETVKVTVIEAVNILVNGNSVALTAGETVELPASQVKKLASLGYVELPPEPKKKVKAG